MKGPVDGRMPEFRNDAVEEDAALYALGVLDSESTARFEELLATDPAAVAVLERFRSPAEPMAESLAPVTPPAHVKERLFRTIQSAAAEAPVAGKPEPAHEAGIGAMRSHEGKWKPTGIPGIMAKKLYVDRASGLLSTLLRMEPGSVYPPHKHTRTEQ